MCPENCSLEETAVVEDDPNRALDDYALSLVAPGKAADRLAQRQEVKSIHFDAIFDTKNFSRHFACQADANPEEL